jgi:23S rRNA pseudouridine2605 synthase
MQQGATMADEGTSLIKFIAAHSYYSRRKAADLIKNGQVKVNGLVVRKPWTEVTDQDDIRIDRIKIVPEEREYIILNKPEGYITSMSDIEGRPVSALIKGASRERLFPVGRLDKDTTGILLFTNDGILTQKLTHPRFSVSKEYQVTLNKPVVPEHLKALAKGIFLTDGFTHFDRAVHVANSRKFVILVEIHSGKKRIIRRLFGKLGYEVTHLDRVKFAGLSKRDLPVGKWRKLEPREILRLKKLAGLIEDVKDA